MALSPGVGSGEQEGASWTKQERSRQSTPEGRQGPQRALGMARLCFYNLPSGWIPHVNGT